MEKLIKVNDNGSAELLTNLKRFDNKWMTKNHKDVWEFIEGIYFEVSHLEDKQITELLNRFYGYEDDCNGDKSENKCWAESIDWKDATTNTISTYLVENIPVGEPGNLLDLLNYTQEEFENNSSLNLKEYQIDILNEFDNNYNNIGDDMIETIVSDIYNPSIMCDNPEDEKNIINYLESFYGFSTKYIAKKLLYNGSLKFEVLKGENNRYLNYYDKGSAKNKVEGFFFVDIDLKSYYNSTMDNYENLNLINSNLKCSKNNSNEYFNNSVTYKEYKFIKESFLLSDYFNVSQTSKYNLLNINDYKNFMNLLEKSIVDFYYSLIKADDRFKNINFKLEI